jgi:DNA excision repair protein ERCC-2
MIDQRSLAQIKARLAALLTFLEVEDLSKFSSLNFIADFSTMISCQFQHFSIIIEPSPEENQLKTANPLLQLTCLDPSLVLRPFLEKFSSVIFASSILPAASSLPRILKVTPATTFSPDAKVARPTILPVLVTKGVDQIAITNKFSERDNQGHIRNFGTLMLELA